MTQQSLEEGKHDSPTIKQVMLEIPFPETFVYANCTAFAMSHMDFHLSFAEAGPNNKITAKVGIVMPAEHAATLALTLVQQLVDYEKAFGPIRQPAWREVRKQFPNLVPPDHKPLHGKAKT